MGADRHAVVQQAQSLVARGQINAAIAEWKKLLTDDPADASVYNSIGDLELKRKAPKEAVLAYEKAAQAFQKLSEPLKAIAAYKKILKIDPSSSEVYRHLADLNAERGLVSSAIAEYSTLAQIYSKRGKTDESLEVYRKILQLDPSNLIAQQQVAELSGGRQTEGGKPQQQQETPQKQAPKPRPEPRPTADQEVHQKKKAPSSAPGGAQPKPPADAPPAAAKKPLSVSTMDLKTALAEAGRYLKEGDYSTAEEILTHTLNQHPGDPDVCRLLARLHLKRGDSSLAQNEYAFLAGGALRTDDLRLAESLVKEFLDVDSSAPMLLEILGEIYERRGNIKTAALHYGKALQALLEHPDPDIPILPEELFEKIKELDPSSFMVAQFAPAIETRSAQVRAEEVHQPEPSPPAPDTEPPPVPAEAELAPQEPVAAQVLEAASSSEDKEEESVQTVEEVPQAVSQAFEAIPDLEPDDSELHFVLGKAYKDMGLHSEAMEELQRALAAPNFFLESCLELAICLKEQGNNKRAILCLEHALSDPSCDDARTEAIRYEIGLLYEAEGMLNRALETFKMIPAYRDVPRRLEYIESASQSSAVSIGAEGSVEAGQAISDGPVP